MPSENVLDELARRNLLQDATNVEELRRLLSGEAVSFYAGFDPSGISLHAGSLVPLAVMRQLAMAGHRPIAVIGGATGMIGDPSGKSDERKLLERELLERNVQAVGAQIARLLPEAQMVNNADWTKPLSYLDFLRDVGKFITVNYMLAKESVRSRLEDREQGISYTEFSYMLLQAYDFAHLARTLGVRLQVGGSDQWGNITCGIELARKLGGLSELFGLVAPLLMTASGKKFGKTEVGTSVWLDADMTSPYRFYQHWLNTEDADVSKFLKMFTTLPVDVIEAIVQEHDADRSKRIAQRRLASELTKWVHGEAATVRAERASQVMFGGSLDNLEDQDIEPLRADIASVELTRGDLESGISLVDILVRTGLAKSKTAARQLASQGGVYVNNLRSTDVNRTLRLEDLATKSMMVLRAGKKDYCLLIVKA